MSIKMSDLHPSYDSWFECWYEDKKDMLACMYRNLSDDLNAGYDPMGDCIKRQCKQIESYENDINETLTLFASMEDKKRDRWCFYDMLKRGAIA